MKKSTIAKFGMNEGELRMINGGVNSPKDSGENNCEGGDVGIPK